jgi:hypothetical protein
MSHHTQLPLTFECKLNLDFLGYVPLDYGIETFSVFLDSAHGCFVADHGCLLLHMSETGTCLSMLALFYLT